MGKFLKELLALAPDVLPEIIKAIFDVEKIYSGLKQGEIKKEAVMNLVEAFLETKDYFFKADSKLKVRILGLADASIDYLVSIFNITGVFEKEELMDFTPKDNPEGGSK